ncbi:MAG: EamA family transporter [Thermoplasmata archaeon]|nr:MAG: EamA family transporter [Thermoplasmata archaeon]MCD6222991.1 EamA family transporter [Thermoplasmata archaeon]
MKTILLSILVIFLWGLWAFLFKIGVEQIGIKEALIWNNGIAIVISILIISFLIPHASLKIQSGVFYVMVATALGISGSIIWYIALEKEKASIVVSFTALYPLITVVLSVIFLKEKLSLENWIGIIFALIAGILLSL